MQLSDVLNISNPYSEPSQLCLTPCEPNKNIIEARTGELPFQFKANKEPLPPIMPTKWSKNLIPEMKETPVEKWKWTSFRNNARKDHLDLHHWEKVSRPQSHYPFAEYDKVIEPIHYADDEYQECISSDGWTKEQTDHLFDLCNKYDLRWPVISDRYSLLPNRTEEECKYRYYSVCKKILSHRKARNFTLTPFQESILNYQYDQGYDIERNRQYDKLFKISKLEELEIHKLENELNVIESLIKEIVYNDITSSSSNSLISLSNNNLNNNNNNKSFNKRHRNMKSNSIIDEFITDSELNEYIKNPNNMLLYQHPFYQPLSQQQIQQNQQNQQQLSPGVVLRSQRFEITVYIYIILFIIYYLSSPPILFIFLFFYFFFYFFLLILLLLLFYCY